MATGLEIRDGYGQTETCCLVGNYKGFPVKPGSMGKPSPGYDIAVIDDDAQPVAAGKEGDIGVRIKPVRPVGLFREYWKNDQANRSWARGDYYVTGDRGIMDAEGYVWFVGGADDVILSAGHRIGPFEVGSASSSTRRSPSRPSSRVRTTFAVKSSRPASSSSPDSPPRTR